MVKHIRELQSSIKKREDLISSGAIPIPFSSSQKQSTVFNQVKATAIHEIGHYRHFKTLGRKMPYIIDKNKILTEYSAANKEEYFAEFYYEWRINGDKNIPPDLLKLFKEL